MAFGSKSTLPAIRSGSVALVAEGGSSIVVAARPPKPVTRGALEIMAAFPAPGATDGDQRISLDLYYEAVEGYALAVVLWTLKWLVFHNPRNTPTWTCRPTPQDVREACKRTNGQWQRWAVEFYLGGPWAKPSTNTMLTKDNDDLMERHYAAQRGGNPGEPDCVVPSDLCVRYLREYIEKELPGIETADERMRNGYYADPLLLNIKDETLERMPQAAFPDGAREKIRSIRDARAEAARKAAEHEAYINSLPDEVRAVRWTVVTSAKWKDIDEAQVMAETNRRLEIIQEGRADAEANGGEFTGCSFDDGTEWHESRRTDNWRRSIRRANV